QEAAAADLVMPSKLTGMLASGRPVVAASAQGTEIAAAVEGSGLISPPGDEEAMADSIRRLVHDPDLRARLGANGRSYAEEHLSRDKILTSFETALKQLVLDKRDIGREP
ncbi:MAG: glycosyltransferase, partial [Thermoleophilia bacterium]|nr:glycosyltransferase [Thermoleophilia bacterium]